ncbi:MAG TPA: hydrogenase maturation protease, partial [Frankiaceae bacterium]|nr:hydrogenase maturation protease [Frankiaceae bacterium]
RLAGEALPNGIRVVDYGIRGMHLAYDLLDGVERLILLDALPRGGRPGDVVLLEVGPDDVGQLVGVGEIDAHGMAPLAVLASLDRLGGELPPTLVVGCEPLDVRESMGLTPPVAAAVEVAVAAVHRLLTEPDHLPSATGGSHQHRRSTP